MHLFMLNINYIVNIHNPTMKKYSNKRLNKTLKRKQKERLRRKNNKQSQKLENSNVVSFDQFDLSKLTMSPFENKTKTIKMLYDNKPLIIKTPAIKIQHSFPKQEQNNNLSMMFTLDETNEEHKSLLNVLSKIDEQIMNMKIQQNILG